MSKEQAKNLIIFLLVFIIIIQAWLWIALYGRTKVANYDVKIAHYNMSNVYKYCPYCGEELEEVEK